MNESTGLQLTKPIKPKILGGFLSNGNGHTVVSELTKPRPRKLSPTEKNLLHKAWDASRNNPKLVIEQARDLLQKRNQETQTVTDLSCDHSNRENLIRIADQFYAQGHLEKALSVLDMASEFHVPYEDNHIIQELAEEYLRNFDLSHPKKTTEN